jgi:hypothetical protein
LRASNRVAQLLAKESKPFSDEEFVRRHLQLMLQDICQEKETVPALYVCLVQQRRDKIILVVNYLMNSKTKLKNLKAFLALDESNDTSVAAQLLIVIRRKSESFEVVEELASLKSLNGTATREDFFLECVKP